MRESCCMSPIFKSYRLFCGTLETAVHPMLVDTDTVANSSPECSHSRSCAMRLEVSKIVSRRVKGFFKKKSSKTEQEVVSTLEMDVVAVPRQSVITKPSQ